MASYNYPPPGPPGPPPSQGPPPPAPYTPYGAAAPQYRGSQAGGRGRGGFHQGAGPGRGETHPAYAPGPQAYPPANNQYHPSGGYPQQPGWQQHPEQQGHHPQPPTPATPLPPQNYHPNYAPQIYQQPQYPAAAGLPQPPYQPPPPAQPYHPAYAHPPTSSQPQHDWSAQQHGGHGPSQHGYSGGNGRGRGGGDRGGRPAPVMGPPIRMGFDENHPHNPAQASNGYQPYPDPRQTQYPPYNQSYPPVGPAPMLAQSSSYDYYGRGGSGGGPVGNSRGRSGFNHNRSGRGYHNNSNNHHNHGHGHNDKFRHQKSGGPAANSNDNNQQHQKPDESSAGKKKKRKTNPNDRDIGLLPTEVKEEGVEEEAELKELIGNALPMPTDLAKYIAIRKSCYPTKARVEAKKAELAKLQLAESQQPSTQPSSLELKELERAKLQRRLEKLDSQIKRKRDQNDEGDDMRDVDDSSSVSSEEEGKPEVVLAAKPTTALPPPPSKADPTKHCKYYSTGGTCGKKGKCRFVHDPAVREAAIKQREANGGKLTLEQRLLLNDKDQEDLTVLKAIQHIKEIGKLSGDGFRSSGSISSTSILKSAAHSSLPPPSDSLPPHPPMPSRPQIKKETEFADDLGAEAAGSDRVTKEEDQPPQENGNSLQSGNSGAA